MVGKAVKNYLCHYLLKQNNHLGRGILVVTISRNLFIDIYRNNNFGKYIYISKIYFTQFLSDKAYFSNIIPLKSKSRVRRVGLATMEIYVFRKSGKTPYFYGHYCNIFTVF